MPAPGGTVHMRRGRRACARSRRQAPRIIVTRRRAAREMKSLDKLNRLSASHGALRPGHGLVSGVIALGLASLCFLGVLAFHFPEYLTTPQLRKAYDVDLLRRLMLGALVVSGALALVNIIRGRAVWLALAAFVLVALTLALGGHKVAVNDFPDDTPYIGLDWFILDLLGSALIFVFIEKLFGLRRDQPVFRAQWQTDLHHFIVNHMMVGFVLLAVNLLVHKLFGWAAKDGVRFWVQDLPFPVALFLIVLVADLMQYWTHRAYHEVPWLWRLHAVHHSVKCMDWLAGSRQHILEVILTRTLVLAPIFVLGFSKEVIDAYILIVGFQAVFNHANVSVRLGPLRHVIVTPNFHHWHHSQDTEAIDKNYAAHFAFLDHLFGTAVRSTREWPAHYGVQGDYVPAGFWRQFVFPFTWKG
jgi:sterol desaturase/sphingolipid hydroxylase (fatty acid hydroxylase superfamily)